MIQEAAVVAAETATEKTAAKTAVAAAKAAAEVAVIAVSAGNLDKAELEAKIASVAAAAAAGTLTSPMNGVGGSKNGSGVDIISNEMKTVKRGVTGSSPIPHDADTGGS